MEERGSPMRTQLGSGLRQLVPANVKHWIKRSRWDVKYRSSATNIYHCCVHKGGSQWIKKILSDQRTYRYSGLVPYTYQVRLPGRCDPRKITERTFDEPFPRNTIVTPLYIVFENFEAIPKPENYKAFYVMRDPRDLIVSKYFSTRHSHPPIGRIPQIRELLNNMSFKDGMLYVIEYFHDRGRYATLRSWIDLSSRDENVLLFRFEDLSANDNLEFFKKLFHHCDIRMPEEVLSQLIYDYSFKRLSSGRTKGEADKSSHYRKGIHGDWKNHFDETIKAKFKEVTGDLVVRLGYEQDLDW